MKPVLVSCYFSAKKEPDGQYDRLAAVLAHTAARHCPGWDIQITRIDPTLLAPCTGNPSHSWNSAKLDFWSETVQQAPDGTPLVLMDADTAIFRSLDPLWAQPFDLAYTRRETSRLPLNGGVVALRVSEGTKAAMAKWQQMNAAMLVDGALHAPWHRKYAGMNQASFGCLLEEGGFADLAVAALPCTEWNCCEWATFNPAVTRIVHYKSRLRRATFKTPLGSEDIAGLVAHWHGLESEMREARRRGPA